MADLVRDINALPDDVDEDLKEMLLRLAKNDPLLTNADLRFKLEGSGDLEVVILAKALENNSMLKELSLASNKLSDAKVKVLSDAFAKNKSLVKVDLCFNSITNAGTVPLVKALQQNASIQQVLLFHNQLTQDAINTVTEALKSDQRGKSTVGNPEDKKVIDTLQKAQSLSELAAVKQERDMFRQRIEEMEKEIAGLRKNVGAMPPAKSSPLNQSTANVRQRKEKIINCENVQVMEKLAETGGSSASVFSCNVDGWNCAMKEMDLSGMHGDSAANFEGEIELLERLPFHNNICRYLFHDKRNNKLRLFMTKYASSLRKIIVERRKEVEANPPRNRYWSREEIITMLLDVAKGLVFLHQNNVIHRDLKSDNIFVTLNERKDVSSLAIGDFDTAKRVTTVNQAKTILGTPGYIAPEVLKSNEAGGYSFKADVFSFGMVLYELLTLKLPFEDEMPFLVATQIMRGQRPPIPDHLDDTYDDLKELFLKCTLFNPQQRPDMLAVKEELVKFM